MHTAEADGLVSPKLHGRHDVANGGDQVPDGHGEHTMPLNAVPATLQTLQVPAAKVEPVPAGQAEQMLSPPAANVPGAHATQELDSLFGTVPTGHVEQLPDSEP